MYQRFGGLLFSCLSSIKSSSRDTVAAELRSEIAKQEAACGCELGSIFTFAALALFLAHLAECGCNWWAAEARKVSSAGGLGFDAAAFTTMKAANRAEGVGAIGDLLELRLSGHQDR